jgi:hypothetical protein
MKVEFEVKIPQQIFTHLDNDGVARTFLVETMQEFYKKYPNCSELIFAMAPVDQKLSDYLRARQGIEQPRVDRLVEPWLSEPVIGILWEDGETTIIDGNHRIVKSVEVGRSHVRAVLFKHPFWEQFLLPEDITKRAIEAGCLTNDSNIIEKEKMYGCRN